MTPQHRRVSRAANVAAAAAGLVVASLAMLLGGSADAKLTPGPDSEQTEERPARRGLRLLESDSLGGSTVARVQRSSDGAEIWIATGADSVKISVHRGESRRGVRSESESESNSQNVSTDDALVRFGEDIVIEADQEIAGDVVAIGGDIEVFGLVEGDVVSVGGEVFVRPGGAVEGDVVSLGGEISRDPGARILGSDIDLHVLPGWAMDLLRPGVGHLPLRALATFLVLGALCLLALFVDLFWGGRASGLTSVVRDRFWSSLGIGLIVLLLAPPTILLLAVTLIGIPLAVLAPPFLFLGLLVGFVLVARQVGQHLLHAEEGDRAARLAASAVGLALLVAVPFAGNLLRSGGGVASLFGSALEIFGITVWFFAAAAGFGALLRTRFGWRLPPTDDRRDGALRSGLRASQQGELL